MKKKFFEQYITKQQMTRISMVVVLLVFALNSFAAAENTLTLGEAIDIALSHNKDLKQAANQVKTSEISMNQKKADFLPTLSASANASQQYFKSSNVLSGNYENQNSRTLDGNITASVNVFNGFYDKASLQKAQLELNAQENTYARSSQAVVFETIQRYIQVVLAKDLIAVEKENLESQKLQLNLIEDYFKAGLRPITDVYQQKSEISKAEYTLLEAERNYKVNLLLLLQTIGLQPTTGYKVAGLNIDKLLGEIKMPGKEEALNQAFEKRTDLSALDLSIKAAEKDIKIAKSGLLPKVTLKAGIGTDYSSLDKSSDLSSQLFKHNLNGSIGLSLSIPIFDKGTTNRNIATARINVQNQQLALEKQRNQVEVEVQQAIEDYLTAVRQVESAESQFSYAQSALESIEARYKEKASTMVELTQTRTQYLEASYNRVKSKYNLVIQAVAAAFYQGNPDEITALIRK